MMGNWLQHYEKPHCPGPWLPQHMMPATETAIEVEAT